MSVKTERVNLRCSTAMLSTLRQAAELQGQDLTSFVMSAAIDRAREVLTEDRILRLDPVDVIQLERALDAPAAVNPQLKRLFDRVRATEQAHA
jgi:uncharacterized protein (DUF1778 family)